MANVGPFDALGQGLAMDFTTVERVGPDIRIVARVRGRDIF
jgi:diaminohydroxyphosphoribosylaminopyrimidine deaminase/5-amino-6-(5-phosphoribosylamino)uracil reductase